MCYTRDSHDFFSLSFNCGSSVSASASAHPFDAAYSVPLCDCAPGIVSLLLRKCSLFFRRVNVFTYIYIGRAVRAAFGVRYNRSYAMKLYARISIR